MTHETGKHSDQWCDICMSIMLDLNLIISLDDARAYVPLYYSKKSKNESLSYLFGRNRHHIYKNEQVSK